MDLKKFCDYIFELATLKKFHHCGTRLAGVPNPDTVAEHVYRAAIIGYMLAKIEKADAEKVMLILLLHDNGETRITDLHKVARRYIDVKRAELLAFSEQVENLPKEIKNTFKECFIEFENAKTKEAIIARDADMLETAFQAKEYLDIGHKACQDWIDNVAKCVRTKSAKAIVKQIYKTPFTDWWRGLKKIEGY